MRFTVSHQAVDGEMCFLHWRCTGTRKAMAIKPWLTESTSELRFGPDGCVRERIDHWDAAQHFYERLPIIGGLLRLIRQRLSSH